MELNRRSTLVYGLLLVAWVLVVGWQVEEHHRFTGYEKNSLRNRSKAIANTLGASIRGLRWGGRVAGDRLQPVMDELVNGPTNEINVPSEVVAIRLLNAQGETVASAGRPIDLQQEDLLQQGERWGKTTVVFVYPVEGATVAAEGATNVTAPILLPPFTNGPRETRSYPRHETPNPPREENGPAGEHAPPGRPPDEASNHEAVAPGAHSSRAGSSERRRESSGRPRRPFWARGMSEQEFQALLQKRELHGLVIGMSTEALKSVTLHDLWLRSVIAFFATISALGLAVAWRTLSNSSELQIRLIRASEMTTHLREMNLAAAGLAHETRNPLNIIRGIAQMISRRPDASEEIRSRASEIIGEADKVAAQLNEFINYSKPRELRRVALALRPVLNEVVRALSYDLEEKKIQLEITGQELRVEADEQLLRQALFNLILNATQAVNGDGKIEISTVRESAAEAAIEIRDNGPGVAPEHREDIFKPYFTTQKTGTGLGLAVVQQIILAHGWEIACLKNEPRGAVFRITHLKLRN